MFFRLSLFQKILQINCNESKQQQKLDADPKAIQQFNFTGNIDTAAADGDATMFFITEEAIVLKQFWIF